MSPSSTSNGRHRVVIIGSGFGALFAAKRLKRAHVDITMISRTSYHLFQPLLYQVATGILSEGEIAPSTRSIVQKQKNLTVLLGDVYALDLAARTITSAAAGFTTVTPYDTLIVAAGSSTSYFGNDSFELNAPGLKTVDDALELRGRIFGAFELAELEPDPKIQEELLTFVIVGAGATGVELAGQISELARRTLPKDFRRIDTRKAKIILVDALGTVLGNFGLQLSARAAAQLDKLGVEVWLKAKVTDVDETGLTVQEALGGEAKINSRTVIWAAGVRASTLGRKIADQSAAEVDRAGRVLVEPDLTVPGHPEVFVLGDMMALNNYPGVAQVAMQGGKYAADQIKRRVTGHEPKPAFKYFDKGSMATISRFKAVAQVGKFHFDGFIAWLLWLAVHVIYLVGFKNRFSALMHWAISFLGHGRSQRTTTHQQYVGRAAMRQLDIPYLGVAPTRAQVGATAPPTTAARRTEGVSPRS